MSDPKCENYFLDWTFARNGGQSLVNTKIGIGGNLTWVDYGGWVGVVSIDHAERHFKLGEKGGRTDSTVKWKRERKRNLNQDN